MVGDVWATLAKKIGGCHGKEGRVAKNSGLLEDCAVAGAINPRRLVFVDEMGTNTPRALSDIRLLSPRGRRTYYAKVPPNRGANTTLLASMSLEGMGPCLAVQGPVSATVFEAYVVEKVLAPSLRRGQRSWWWTTSSALTRKGAKVSGGS
jgi:hypothetical protein